MMETWRIARPLGHRLPFAMWRQYFIGIVKWLLATDAEQICRAASKRQQTLGWQAVRELYCPN
jgi:hypothetical protein